MNEERPDQNVIPVAEAEPDVADTDPDVPDAEAERVHTYCTQFLEARTRLFSFPGFHLAKAIELAIVGSHYRTVVNNVLESDNTLSSVA